MTALAIFLVLVVVCIAAPFYGTDTRRYDDRGWWPGRRAN
jgi:hypothetical protein